MTRGPRYLWRGWLCQRCGQRINEADGMFEVEGPDGVTGPYCRACTDALTGPSEGGDAQ